MKFLKKNSIYLIILAIIGVIILIPGLRNFAKNQLMMKPAMNKIENEITVSDADYNIQLKGINVPDANLKDFKGKTVFLNFWGTWCPPCRAEFPTIQKLYDAKKNKIDFVLIAMQDKEEAVEKFLTENKYNVPVYIAKSPISEKLLPNVFPTTYLLGKNGFILKKEENSADWFSESSQKFIDAMTK